MFPYIRWLSAISLVFVICAMILLGDSVRQAVAHNLTEMIEKNNVSLARSFTGARRESYGKMKYGLEAYQHFRASNLPAKAWKNAAEYPAMLSALSNFAAAAQQYFAGMPNITAQIYMSDGARLISGKNGISLSDPYAVTAEHSDSAFYSALKGKPASAVIFEQLPAHSGDAADRGMLVKTFIPLLPTGPNQDVKALIEIRYNATPQWRHIERLYWIAFSSILALLLGMEGALFFIYRKLENIITEHHEKNLVLTAQLAAAQSQSVDKSQFLANVSHELRTPLNAIIGFSEIIRSERVGPLGNAIYLEYIKDVYDSGVHLLSLINDILDYSKAEVGKLSLEISEVNVTNSIRNSMRLITPRAEKGKVRLVELIPPEHFMLRTDARKLKQVMLNLLSNAVKFTPAGGSVTVAVWQSTAQGGLSIEVSDTGIGIAPKDISRAMAPFGQVKNILSKNEEGTGLGLPLTQKFIEIMGGIFTIGSEVGRGTTITIILPKDVEAVVT